MKKNTLTKLVEKFIDKDCDVQMGDHFAYIPAEETILITLHEDNKNNDEWKIFLKKNFNFDLTRENLLTMSILHELGHHYTVDLFSDEEWCLQATEECLGDLTGTERCQAYYNLPIEKIATNWAVEVYNTNSEAMRAWNHRLFCAVRHYEKRHHVKSSLTTF